MKIIHCCLSCFYIDGFAYQENELVSTHVSEGHDVLVIASTETYGPDKRIAYLDPCTYIGSDGAKVIRLPYKKVAPQVIMRKLRIHSGFYTLLEKEKPDVIIFHGLCGWELNTVVRYKKAHPAVKLYADSHEDFNNSARTFLSKFILHGLYYRLIINRCTSIIDRILCVSVDTISFVRDFYGVPDKMIEFFPLGGKVFNDDEYFEARLKTRELMKVKSDEIVFIQSGKIDGSKKLIESLRAFRKIEGLRFQFHIVGHLDDSIAEEVHELIRSDSRIHFWGWKSSNDLRMMLCAADIYVQPGTQSATMQMSLCCRCVVIVDDVPSHKPYINDNGWLVGNSLAIDDAFHMAAESAFHLPLMSQNSAHVAARLLDYKILAARICQ